MTHEIPEATFIGRQALEPASVFHLMSDCYMVLIIGIWNLNIYQDFIQTGLIKGDEIRNTGNYVIERQSNPAHRFYLIASHQDPYFYWGEPSLWQNWIQFFATPDQSIVILSPDELLSQEWHPPLTLFLGDSLWQKRRRLLQKWFPDGQLQQIHAERSLWAFEVVPAADTRVDREQGRFDQ